MYLECFIEGYQKMIFNKIDKLFDEDTDCI